MNMIDFLHDLDNGRFVNQDLTKKYGYVDFIVEGDELPRAHDIRAILPKEFAGDYIATLPGVPLSNGKYVYYCRANINIVTRLLKCPAFEKLFLSDSWNRLFESDFPYWAEIFYVQTNRKDDSGKISCWQGKFSQLTERDEVIRVGGGSGVFEGDASSELEIKDWQIKNYLYGNKIEVPKELNIIINAVNDELIKYLSCHPKELYKLKPRQFEELICEILKSFGWEVELTPATRDGGYDIFAITKDILGMKSSWIIECKKYAPERKVGIEYVRSLCGVKNDLKIANAMIATTSFFTSGVQKAKNSRYDLELADYNQIVDWLNVTYKREHKTGLLLPN